LAAEATKFHAATMSSDTTTISATTIQVNGFRIHLNTPPS
jgi:hypothetical protein